MTSRYALVPAWTAAAALVLAIVLPFAGCGLPLKGLSGKPDAGPPCDVDGQCDDKNPCTADACTEGACEHVAQPDGPAPSGDQAAFDCKVLACVSGLPQLQNDNQDIAVDAEDCTIDTCNGGVSSHTAKIDGVGCTMGGDGRCKGGKCQVACTVDATCNDNNPCTQDSCDVAQGLCAYIPLNGENTPGAAQTPGDCQVEVCVNGVSIGSPDDSDLPTTATDCDEELCNSGVPSKPPLQLDAACGQGDTKYCNGTGACVECNLPSQCGVDTECLKVTCIAGACGTMPTPVNTPVAQQTPGDCRVVVCDGAGNQAPQPVIDNTDPFNDNNPCTADACASGTSSNKPLAPGSACGNGQACNSKAQCGCSNDGQCTSPDKCGGGNPGTPFTCGCTQKDCATLGKTCGTVSDTCYAMLNCNSGSQNGTETDVDCGGGANETCGTTCAQGKQCSVNIDCTSGFCADGVCCNTACTGACVACTAAKKGSGSDGVCGSIPVNQPDTFPANICVSPKACDGVSNCKKTDGQTCGGNSECVSGSCADGVCCNTTCNGTCLACSAAKKGGGADGVCGNIPVNQTDTAATVQCTGTSSCDGNGACKRNVGQICASDSQCVNANCVDSVCCGVADCPACQSCAVGANGTCGDIPAGPDSVTPNTCTGTSSCDGMGNCKKSNGQGCATTAECSTGTCVDGVCCGVASCPACKSCAMGVNGTCGNIAAGPDSFLPNTCTGVSSCDGMGNCKKVNGQTCAATSECATGTCVDGVCCGVASCPACQSCAQGAGACGPIASGMPDIAAPNTCMGTSLCDGMGNCKKVNGQTCATTLECVTGTCVDGVCCGVTECPACQSCTLGVMPGTCGNIANGQPDNTAPNTCPGNTTCDGAGNCVKAANGQPCMAAQANKCQSGICADGVCCDVTCDNAVTCKSCSLPTKEGTCSPVISADDIDSCPPATTTCSATSMCLTKIGSPCSANGECASGNCSSGMTKVCQ